MTHRDRRQATEDANADLAAYCGRHITRARAEAANSTAEREPVEFDLGVADRMAKLRPRLSRETRRVMIPTSTLIRNYICRVCGSHLVIRPDRVHCAADPVHFSWIKKTTTERWIRERGITNFSILNDRALIEAIPDWPKPERPTAEQCYEELFD